MFSFYTAPIEFDADIIPARIAGIKAGQKDVKSLIAAIGEVLDFPKFAGKNFDAFWDSLRELPDETPYKIVLLHEDLPALPAEDLATYLRMLRDAVVYWNEYSDEHSLEVWFPMSVRDKVRAVTKKMPPPEDVE